MRPAYLRSGDKVYLLNISRKGSMDLSFITDLFKRWELLPVLGKTLAGEGYCQFSAPLRERLADLQKAIDDPEIKALFFCRGGYGAVQLLDHIDFSKFVKTPKWLTGFSDITYLHAHIHANHGIETIHSPMLFNLHEASPSDVQTLYDCLFGNITEQTYTGMENYKTNTVSGPLCGGNLSILHTITGSATAIDPAGKILFLEDVHEDLTGIERMLYSLKRAGKFNKLRALLVGDFIIPAGDDRISNSVVEEYSDPSALTINKAFRLMVLNLLKEYDFPVCFGIPAGHLANRNTSMYFGREIRLEMTTEKLTIQYL